MGTSKSFGGMKDINPLLPGWSLSDISSNESSSELANGSEQDVNTPVQGEPAKESEQDVNTPEPRQTQTMPWKAANTSLGKLTSGNSSKDSLAKAGRSYTRAQGGSKAAASSSTSARASSAKLGSFLSSIGSKGINQTLSDFGLSHVIGKDADWVVAAILDFIAPNIASRQDSIVRESMCETLEDLYEKYDLANADITNLDQMGISDIEQVFEKAISSYVYNRWLAELGIAIEKKSVSPSEAVNLEREIKIYVRESISIDLQEIDILNFDWQSSQGQQFIEKKFQEAFELI